MISLDYGKQLKSPILTQTILIRWDNGWLFATLKKHYFEDYYDSKRHTKYQLEELLSNKKNYYSVIKNSSDFDLLNEGFQETIVKHQSLYESLEFQQIEKILNNHSNNVSMLYKLEAYFEAYYKDKFDFKYFIKDNIIKFIKDNHSKTIEHEIIVYKSISLGLKTEPNIYKNEDIVPLSEFSNIKNILESEKYMVSYFYIYLNLQIKTFVKKTRNSKVIF